MDNENDYKTYCSRCGAEMNVNSRYCMKCGNLNYSHEANESMRDIMQVQEQTYQIGSGQFIVNNDGGNTRETVATNTGNKLICFVVNFFLFIVLLVFGFFVSTNGSFQPKVVLHSFFPFIAIALSLFFLYFYAWQLIYMKCNKKWWVALIPVYNMMELSHIIYHKRWIGLLTLIPVLGIIPFIVMLYKLGTYFNYNGVVVVLLSFVFIPLMGFGVSSFRGYVFVNDNSWMNLEREYRFKKLFFTSLVLSFVVGMGSIVTTNFSYIEEIVNKINNYYYVYAAKRVVSKVKGKVAVGNYNCTMDFDESKIVYFYFPDLRRSVYLPFSMLTESITAYVKIDKTEGDYQYYVSLGDGKKGFSEINIKNVKLDTVIDYTVTPTVKENSITCEFMY